MSRPFAADDFEPHDRREAIEQRHGFLIAVNHLIRAKELLAAEKLLDITEKWESLHAPNSPSGIAGGYGPPRGFAPPPR
jgi:hypothetical protein